MGNVSNKIVIVCVAMRMVSTHTFGARRLLPAGGFTIFIRDENNDQLQAVELEAGANTHDLYDAVEVNVDGHTLQWRGTDIADDASTSLADLGIGPESIVHSVRDNADYRMLLKMLQKMIIWKS